MTESDTRVRDALPSPERHDVPAGGRSGFVVVEGRQVHYLEWGRSRATPVLALHGGGQTAYMYEALGTALRDTHHVLAPDLPHHGESDPLPNPADFSRVALAETLPPLLDEFGMGPVAVVGASLGGIAALTLAARRPGLVRAVVLIDVGHRLEDEGVARIITFMREHESFGTLEEAAAAIGTYLPRRPPTDASRLRRNLRQRSDGRWVWKHGMGGIDPDDERVRDWRSVVAGLAEDAGRVRAPVLVLRGAHSDVLSADGADEITRLLPDAVVAEVGAAGHLAAGDNPSSVVSLVREFLARVGG